MTEEVEIYKAPNIRDQAITTLQFRGDQRRDRRLMAAIEVNQKKQAQSIKLRDKSLEKFSKLVASAEKRLDAARDLIDKADEEIRQLTVLHNSVSLLDEELK